MWHRRNIRIAESFPGFSMAIIFHCLHILGILFSMKHMLSIVCNHLYALGPRFFSCSTRMSSMPAALLFLRAAIPFLYSSSRNADTNDGYLLQLVVQGTYALLALFLGHWRADGERLGWSWPDTEGMER